MKPASIAVRIFNNNNNNKVPWLNKHYLQFLSIKKKTLNFN